MQTASATRDAFVEELHKALQHLYDPAELRKSRLLNLFGLDKHPTPLSALRQNLLNSIQTLKPGSHVPAHAPEWRIYEVLTFRYVEQISQKEVATDLALSIRQLRRQEKLAVRALADYLWTRHKLDQRADDLPPASVTEPAATTDGPASDQDNELEWLKGAYASETADVTEMIKACIKTIAPLAKESGAQIEFSIPEDVPLVVGVLTSLRQAVLTLLSTAVRLAHRGTVRITVNSASQAVTVHVQHTGCGSDAIALDQENVESLEMAGRLIALCGGTLELRKEQGQASSLDATLVLPTTDQWLVLVIDDNGDTLQLLKRYLAGSHYRFIGTREPDKALSLTEEMSPDIIVLDVMLPGIDGWELLGRLREHPRTRNVPVVISTILPQEQLALALGAAAFLRKPISRETLLSSLDRLLLRPATEPR